MHSQSLHCHKYFKAIFINYLILNRITKRTCQDDFLKTLVKNMSQLMNDLHCSYLVSALADRTPVVTSWIYVPEIVSINKLSLKGTLKCAATKWGKSFARLCPPVRRDRTTPLACCGSKAVNVLRDETETCSTVNLSLNLSHVYLNVLSLVWMSETVLPCICWLTVERVLGLGRRRFVSVKDLTFPPNPTFTSSAIVPCFEHLVEQKKKKSITKLPQ